MKPPVSTALLVFLLGLTPAFRPRLAAQTPPSPASFTEAPPTPARRPGPELPPVRSPVDFFRELLARRDPAERLAFLTNRSPAVQKLILAKVREYELLPPEQRELRLRVTELHYYLLPLMSMPATNRADQLALVPEDTRKLVEDRLAQWDKLPSEAQRDLLQNEATLRTLTDLGSGSPARQQLVVTGMTETQKAELEGGIRRWQGLSLQQRSATIARFNQFFDLTTEEKARALASLSEAERHQLNRTLASFENLTPLQRAKCVRSFEKFASLSLEERRQFLQSAERWKVMSPSQRQLWRDLVYSISHQPPVPPGADLPPRPPSRPPPLPAAPVRMTQTN